MAVLLVQYLRHIFFFRQSLLGNSGWLIYVIPFTVVPLIVYMIRNFNEMALFFDDTRWIHSFSYLLTISEKSQLAKYIKSQFTFMTVATIISSRSEEHTSELQSRGHLVCRLLLEKKK